MLVVTVSVILFILLVIFLFFVKNTLDSIDRQARERAQNITSDRNYIKEDSYIDDSDDDSLIAAVEDKKEDDVQNKTPKKKTVTKVTKEELSAQIEAAEDALDAQAQDNEQAVNEIINGGDSQNEEEDTEEDEDEDDIPTYVLDDEDEDEDDSESTSSGGGTSNNGGSNNASSNSNNTSGNNNSNYSNSNYSNNSNTTTSQGSNNYYPPSGNTGNSSEEDTKKEEPDYTQIDDSISFDYEPDEKESSFDGETISNGDVLTGVEVINYINSRKSGTFYIVYEQEKIKIKAKKATAANVPSQLEYEVLIKSGKTSFIPRLY